MSHPPLLSSLLFPSLPFSFLLFHSLPFPSLLFSSLPFSPLPFPSLLFPFLLKLNTFNPHRFTDRLAPWVHYVPIQNDYSDLYDALVFFRGDLAGRGAHEELAAKIGREGREWSLTFWREEDMVAYLFRLFLEYARLMSEDRNELNFELEDDR
ncbi:hypothetical protein AZE42_04185 [Rhizopogon vesiculosus]|uniref:Glycosyl transferase CAP10 domain-containing protein n=1 Tax=Rhizopogon vesiculosus TaxID=180088 RepID=A0A1J8QMN1_9AGAM|nr:hypothetical protein AZE42_04185 [Rhizopogon vesiculosus]